MEKVEIVVTAKDTASQVLRGITSSFGEIGNAVQAMTSGAGIEYLTSQIIAFGKESVNATVAYADEVRRLQQVTGANAEETSRLIQLADDYKISTGELMVAQRMLAKDGITLTTDALAKLSDEYLKLAPGAERSAFLLENFGRSGFKMAELLQQGSASIREMSDAMDGGLILTEENVKAAREYEMALDNLGDAAEEVKVTLGNELIPVLTALMSNAKDDAMFQLGKDIGLTTQQAREFVRTIRELDAAPIDSATQSYTAMAQVLSMQVKPALDDTTIDAEELAKTISASNTALISQVQTLAGVERSYQSEMQNLEQQRLNIRTQIADTPAWDTTAMAEYQGQLDGLLVKENEITTAYKQAAAERIFAMVQQKLAVDGLTDAETNYLLKVGEGMGLYTEEQVARTQEAIKQANDLVSGFDKTQQDMKQLQEKGRQESLEAFRQYGTGVSEILENSESAQLDKSQEAWRLYAEGVGTQLDNNIQKVNEYINALTDIPGEISTTVNITPAPAGDTAGGSTLSGGRTIVYNIQNAYIGADNSIMQVV